jgi:hypothetical protein
VLANRYLVDEVPPDGWNHREGSTREPSARGPNRAGTDVSTGALLLSALIVLLSVLVVPAWRTRHHGGAVDTLSLAALAGAGAVTTWLTLQVISLGKTDTATQSADHAPWLGSILGIPVLVIPLAILVAAVGVAELLDRARSEHPSQPADAVIDDVETGPRYRSGGNKVLGLFQNGQQQTVDMIRGEVAASQLHSVTLLDRAVAQVESRFAMSLEAHARMQASTQVDLGALQQTLADHATSLALALDGVTDVCGAVADQIEASQLERRKLAQAVARLAPLLPAPDSPASTVGPEVEISLVDDEPEAAPEPVAISDPAPTPELVLVPDLSPVPDLDAVDDRGSARSPAARWPVYMRRTNQAPAPVIRLRRRARDAARQMWSRL